MLQVLPLLWCLCAFSYNDCSNSQLTCVQLHAFSPRFTPHFYSTPAHSVLLHNRCICMHYKAALLLNSICML
jgi:hypothetical protein